MSLDDDNHSISCIGKRWITKVLMGQCSLFQWIHLLDHWTIFCFNEHSLYNFSTREVIPSCCTVHYHSWRWRLAGQSIVWLPYTEISLLLSAPNWMDASPLPPMIPTRPPFESKFISAERFTAPANSIIKSNPWVITLTLYNWSILPSGTISFSFSMYPSSRWLTTWCAPFLTRLTILNRIVKIQYIFAPHRVLRVIQLCPQWEKRLRRRRADTMSIRLLPMLRGHDCLAEVRADY